MPNKESPSVGIGYKCIEPTLYQVFFDYDELVLSSNEREELQLICRGKYGIEAFNYIPRSAKVENNCYLSLDFKTEKAASNLVKIIHQKIEEMKAENLSYGSAGPISTPHLQIIGKQYICFNPTEEELERKKIILENLELFPKNEKDFLYGDYPARNVKFAGRQKKLEHLELALIEHTIKNSKKPTSAQLIVGMGGSGKSQLITEFIYRLKASELKKKPHNRRYALIVWLRGEPSLFEQELRKLAKWLGIGFETSTPTHELAPLIFERLSKLSFLKGINQYNSRVLLVLDGADNFDSIISLLPQANIINAFCWVITTRYSALWERYFTYRNKIYLGPFLLEESLSYLIKALKKERPYIKDASTEGALVNLAKLLGNLPLALAQAAAYLNKNLNTSIEDYSENFEKQIVLLGNVRVDDQYEKTILTTWLITLAVILSNSRDAVEIFLVCTYLAGESISKGILRAYWGDIDEEDNAIKIKVNIQIQLLHDYALIHCPPPSLNVRQHGLLQKVVRVFLKNQLGDIIRNSSFFNKLDKKNLDITQFPFKKEVIFTKISESLMEYSRVKAFTDHDYLRRCSLVPHLRCIINEFNSSCDEVYNSPEIGTTILGLHTQFGAILINSGEIIQAKQLLERAIVCYEKKEKVKPINIVNLLNNLSIVHKNLGEIDNQANSLIRALNYFSSKITKDSSLQQIFHHCEELLIELSAIETFSMSHHLLISILINYASYLGTKGEFQLKKNLYQKILAVNPLLEENIKVLLEGAQKEGLAYILHEKYIINMDEINRIINDPFLLKFSYSSIVMILQNLGNSYAELGNFAFSYVLLQFAFDIAEKLYSRCPKEMITIYRAKATLAGKLGDLNSKLQLLCRCCAIEEEVYGKNSAQLAHTYNNISNVYAVLGSHDKRGILLEKAYAIESNFAPNSLLMAHIMTNLGDVNRIAGNKEAEGLLQRALQIKLHYYSQNPSNPDIAITLLNLGIYYLCQNDFCKAKENLEKALEIQQGFYKNEHVEQVDVLFWLGNYHMAVKEGQIAKDYYNQALHISMKCYQDNSHPQVVKLLKKLALIYIDNIFHISTFIEPIQYVLYLYKAQFYRACLNLCTALWVNGEQENQYIEKTDIELKFPDNKYGLRKIWIRVPIMGIVYWVTYVSHLALGNKIESQVALADYNEWFSHAPDDQKDSIFEIQEVYMKNNMYTPEEIFSIIADVIINLNCSENNIEKNSTFRYGK